LQTFTDTLPFFIVIAAMFVQMIWMIIARRARDAYLKDLATFRTPSSRLSRYFRWRVSSVLNSALDAIIFEMALVITVIIMIVVAITPDEYTIMLPVFAFVVILSSASTLQSINRVRGALKIEETVVTRMQSQEDKIGAAKSIILPLLRNRSKDDAQNWFVLYRIAQHQDPVGWSIRDALLDRTMLSRMGTLEPGASTKEIGPKDSERGPGIS
jgi:hypothetical protein